MLATLVVVVSLGLADSVNPVTILVAAYLASRDDARARLASFAIGIFLIYLAGGLVLLLGPGELLHTAAKGPDSRGFDIASLALGAIVTLAAVVLWLQRARWANPKVPDRALRPGSALAVGAVVTAIDLPTAFPYFAAIGAIASSDVARPGQVLLLVIFNVLYVLPMLLLLGAHVALGPRFEGVLATVRRVLDRAAAVVVVGLTLAVGIVLMVKGFSGLS